MEVRPGASATPMSSAELRALDLRAEVEFGLPGLVLMEHAGAGAARELLAEFERLGASNRTVGVLCGPGNNGGDGAVVARWLAAAGVAVRVFGLVPRETLRSAARLEFDILARSGIPVLEAPSSEELELALHPCSVLVDALLGTGASGPPREPCAAWIRALERRRRAGAFVAALDLPSGFDADTGQAGEPAVRAELTLSFAAPKLGFARPGAEAWTGRIVVLPIGVPGSAYRRS
ncbi:MAG: NAD(P)H-hydrate epimerase [Planctomycetota bacterium]